MFDQEDYFRRNKWGSVYIPPYRDLREPPAPKSSHWPAVLWCGAACVMVLFALVAPV